MDGKSINSWCLFVIGGTQGKEGERQCFHLVMCVFALEQRCSTPGKHSFRRDDQYDGGGMVQDCTS